MATVSFTVSAGFVTRMRAVIVAEQSTLQGQPNAVIDEAARVKVRTLIKNWVVAQETQTATSNAIASAAAGVSIPTDVDIT